MNSANRGAGRRIRRIGDGAGVQHYQFGVLRRLGPNQASSAKLMLDGEAVRLGGAASEVLDVKAGHEFILAHRSQKAGGWGAKRR
jgi:hypothetical protein